MNIILSLLYFSVRVLRFFIPREKMAVSPHPHIPALHNGKDGSSPQNVADWATSILAFHQSPDSVLEWVIVSIRWFKNKSGLEHEYAIFTLQDKSASHTEIYLRFDRRSSAEALEPKREDIVMDRVVYAVRSFFYIPCITTTCEIIHFIRT